MKKTLFILFVLFYVNKTFSLNLPIEQIVGADTMHTMNINGDGMKIMVIDQGFDLGHKSYHEQIVTHDFAPFSSVGEGDFIGLSNKINNIYQNTIEKINSLNKEAEIEKIEKIVLEINKKINWFYKKSDISLNEGNFAEKKKDHDNTLSIILKILHETINSPQNQSRNKTINETLHQIVLLLDHNINYFSSPIRNKYSAEKRDFREHGTHVLGIISRIAPKAEIIPVDIGVAMANPTALHDYAKHHNVTAVSMSLELEEPSLLSDLIQGFTANHIPFFKATDNEAIDYSKTEEYKAIIQKSQTNDDLNTYLFFIGFTEYSSNLFNFYLKEKISPISAYCTEKINFILSPGTNVTSTLPANRFGKMTGSSMATPIAAASYALLYNYYKNHLNNNHYTEPKIILETLFNSCRTIKSSEHRIVDLNKAIEYADIDNIKNSSFIGS